jgi:vitamin-K-epoxide reductase (warfarin-sensitive)
MGMRFLIALLAIAGLVVSVLALKVHNMDPSLAPPCAVSEHWDCGAVNHSRFAVFPPRSFDEDPKAKGHIPVAIVGIAGYGIIALLALFGRLWIVLHLAEFGFMCACFLSYLEAFVMEKWCIYCVWSQGLITAILIATAIAVFLRRRASRRSIFA